VIVALRAPQKLCEFLNEAAAFLFANLLLLTPPHLYPCSSRLNAGEAASAKRYGHRTQCKKKGKTLARSSRSGSDDTMAVLASGEMKAWCLCT
jgi:hypothetical protein